MINKIIKIFKVVIALELVVLAGVYLVKHYSPKTANATYWLAYNSDTPQSFIFTVKAIQLQKEDGSWVSVWKGLEEVDLATVQSLGTVAAFKGDIPAGKYKKFSLTTTNKYKVKGSVTIGTTTYHTKTNHTNYETGPAELEELQLSGATNPEQGLERVFDPSAELGGTSISDIYVLVDFSYLLTYSDGKNPTLSNNSAQGMYIPDYPAYALTFGAPSKKEVYRYSVIGENGESLLTIIYDSGDNGIGALVRPLNINNTSGAGDSDMHATLSTSHMPGGNKYVKKNADGTLTIQMESYPDIGRGIKVFQNFKRESHQGIISMTGTGATNYTKTYTATRVQ